MNDDEFDTYDYDYETDEYGADDYDAGDTTIICRECSSEIHEDATMCPVCGWATESDSNWLSTLKPWQLIGLVLAFIAILLFAISMIR